LGDKKQNIIVLDKLDLENLIDILIRNGYEVKVKADYDENDENMYIVNSYTIEYQCA
jgi:hypothetical protein